MKKIICFLSCFLSLAIMYGQGWGRSFPLGNDNYFSSADLIPMPDGGFLINSRVQHNPPPYDTVTIQTYFIRIDASGTELWRKADETIFGVRVVAMQPVADNRLLFVTIDGDTTRLIKTDANLQPLWSQVLDAPAHIGRRTKIKAVPGGYAVVYQQNDQQSEPVRMIKTDLEGNTVWQQDFTFMLNFVFFDLVADGSGNLFAFGFGGNPVEGAMGKVSAAGNLLLTKTYPGTPEAFSPVLLNDNSMAFLDFNNNLRLLDGNGQLVNTLNLPTPIYRIAATLDGNILMVEQGMQPATIKITPAGATIWNRSFNNLDVNYDKAPFAIWALPDSGYVIFHVAGDAVQPYYVLRTDANGLIYTNRLYGHVFADLNGNCLNESGTDQPAAQISVVAQRGSSTYFATTNAAGDFDMALDSGTYVVKVNPPNGLWSACTDSLIVSVAGHDTVQWNTGITTAANCPWPTVSLGAAFLRRCYASNYMIRYANEGNVAADSAVIVVSLDGFLTLNSATVPYTSLGNNTYRFYIGSLAPLEQGVITASVTVSCAAEFGQTHCSGANIQISNPCPTQGVEKPIITVNALCTGDSVAFKIRNIGGAAMSQTAEFVIIEDLIVMRQGHFQLPAQQDTIVHYPAKGATTRMYAGQSPGGSPFFAPTAAVEGCNGPLQPGYWNMFPEAGIGEASVRDCQENVGPLDPNDKQAVPTGYGAEHFIDQGVGIDYKIRFQNIGTDTAFSVTVLDTLSRWLDPSSVRPGASSHPYTFEVLGSGVLRFRFDQIRLPDSSINLAGSQGYVAFRVDQKKQAPLQALISNRAGIFFDLNKPVLTNTTFHRVGKKFLVVVDTWEPNQAVAVMRAIPNPFFTETMLEVLGLDNTAPVRLRIVDLSGREVRSMNNEQGQFRIQKGDLRAGVYGFTVRQNGMIVGRGKLVVAE